MILLGEYSGPVVLKTVVRLAIFTPLLICPFPASPLPSTAFNGLSATAESLLRIAVTICCNINLFQSGTPHPGSQIYCESAPTRIHRLTVTTSNAQVRTCPCLVLTQCQLMRKSAPCQNPASFSNTRSTWSYGPGRANQSFRHYVVPVGDCSARITHQTPICC